ncbi:MAG TPA: pyruvate:ferredoxin (flavodoxin) oxidoreductase [Ruminococcaceae bacterium]|nr:pyruvate:ferredoxin (flavodoxin) oxidoreductase [Oscillospiraceae bacterium]
MARKMKTMDGNAAAAHVAYAFTDVTGIYPITPSSVMAEHADEWAAAGRKNIFGQKVRIVEMQSEGGAAGTIHGALNAGALTTTFTASQGLLLMIPNMYKIAGELLPGVIHVSARCVATHALNIFGDHSDVYACRQTGFAMLCAGSVQETMDLAAVAHLSAIKGRVPFLHFFDGFRTSHEIQKIEVWDYDDLAEMLDRDAVDAFRARALNPAHPVLRGSAQNPDVFFQNSEASNPFYDALPAVVEEYMKKVNAKIGTDYKLFNYYGAPDAERVIVAMGSVCETIEETVDHLNANGEKVGLIRVRLYRPFSIKHLLSVIPKTVKSISVLDRTKEPGSLGEPLYLDVVAALRDTPFANVPVYSGRYGLGSKDTVPGQIISVYENACAAEPKKRFTIGIVDDVTHLSLPMKESPDTAPQGTHSCKFWGLGSDGTVGANKNSIKIIGDHTDMYAQGYFAYDSKKSGGVTISHLRFGKKPIKSTYLISKADFVACHNPSYMDKYDIVQDLKDGGTFLLNTQHTAAELSNVLPGRVKRYLAEHKIHFYIINGIKIGKEIGLGGRINTVLQSAFFKVTGIIPPEDAIKFMKDAATVTYGRKGEKIVKMNHDAIDAGAQAVEEVKIPADWAKATDNKKEAVLTGDRTQLLHYVEKLQNPMNAQKGDTLPVSAFKGREDGTLEQGSAAYEKRGIAVDVPEWIPDNCIQCNFCSYVCPHGVIRPFVLSKDEASKAPAAMKHKPATGLPDLEFSVTPTVLDCTGCGSCANVCPGLKGNKALVMKPIDSQTEQEAAYLYGMSLPDKPEVNKKFPTTSVKGSQFKQPLFEFSGACAGCGETPYAKLATQLFGDRMYIANATGCSSIWGGSAPSTPYTVNKKGRGPAWASSLFEDNAEYGFGMYLGQQQMRDNLTEKLDELADQNPSAQVTAAIKEWKDTKENGTDNCAASEGLISALQGLSNNQLAQEILKNKDFLSKKSVWIFGGDGWAYDIGFGGLDQVVASGEDINILIFDTEVYSNTGGQASKSTPAGSVAQFAAAGKTTRKKDLAGMLMTYGYVYVAHVAMGADYNQCLKTFHEAESYHGPSVIIAYSPCINHGIRGGMGISQTEEKMAVAAGYWNNYRYNPMLAKEGKNPFVLDSKAPTDSYQDFILREVRYSSLQRGFPERAKTLFKESEDNAKETYGHLIEMSQKNK